MVLFFYWRLYTMLINSCFEKICLIYYEINLRDSYVEFYLYNSKESNKMLRDG